jgi:hypothetical protein
MSKRKDRSVLLASILALLSISGCSGGGGGGLMAGGGVGGTGVTVGSVSSFGSILVNDVEFDTTGAVVVVDGSEKGTGDQAARDNLSVGQVVRIEGLSESDGTGTANRIVYCEDVIGPVSSVVVVDANIRKLVVMGQTVVADSQTNFVDTTLTTVAVGNLIEVSGFMDDQGFIQATYLRKRADAYVEGTKVQVRGNASEVNTLEKTFKIKQLTVDYAAADVSSLAGGIPQARQLLEVKGILDSSGTLAAARVTPEDILGVDNADSAEIAGIVTLFNSIEDFEIGGIPVQTDSATEYKGILPEDIGVGSRLTAKGSLTNRQLLADSVRSTTPVRIESNVAGITASSLALDGLDGLSVDVNELARFIGAAADFTEIQLDDHVKIFGKSFSSGSATASKIIVQRQPKDTVALRGPVEAMSVSGAMVTVLGVAIDTALVPDNGFALEDSGSLTRAQFLSSVSVGDSINANGNLAGFITPSDARGLCCRPLEMLTYCRVCCAFESACALPAGVIRGCETSSGTAI